MRQGGVQLIIGQISALFAAGQYLLDCRGQGVEKRGIRCPSRVSVTSAVFAALLAIPPSLNKRTFRPAAAGRDKTILTQDSFDVGRLGQVKYPRHCR